MNDPITTTATAIAIAKAQRERVGALVAAIKNLESDDIYAAYRLAEVKQGRGEKYLDGLSDAITGLRRGPLGIGGAIEEAWKRVLDDIVERASRMNGTEAPK